MVMKHGDAGYNNAIQLALLDVWRWRNCRTSKRREIPNDTESYHRKLEFWW